MEDISAVKIPAFVSSDPALWFGMLESTFELAIPKPITDERTKYNYCVAHLSPDAAMAVRDVILSPGSTNPYSKLKEEVIARCGESKSQEIRRLLAGEQLGDRKPSELFRVMQRRSESHNVADSLLLELFLQQLPPNVQSILASIQPLTAQKASEVADRILEVTPAQVSAASKYSSANSDNCSESELLKELKFLRQEVKELRRSRSFSRNRFNSRNRGKSPKPTASNLCWYHYKFAAKARKCIQPCSFQGNLERAGVAATYALPSTSWESSQQEIRKLLSGEELRSRKPSEILRNMKRRAESLNVDDKLITELFLQCLPSLVETILVAVSDLTLDKAADIADRILEVSPSLNGTFAVSNKKEQSLESKMFREIEKLNKRIDSLAISLDRSRYHRNKNSRERSISNKRDFSICWFHRRF
ncbi:uncharacterized protein TNCT_318171 [Trichonephila clavata]|uniref:DUF7041 domain-containing protein n=1 Tax=Trichonephila clavata TaxID=2740835 RepID=A0A8X6I1R3_TRICU|nr:uncharacterized protein TNCT_318171 [Trichonephila clavata]